MTTRPSQHETAHRYAFIRENGAMARRAGRPITANPYNLGSEEYDTWEEGYKAEDRARNRHER